MNVVDVRKTDDDGIEIRLEVPLGRNSGGIIAVFRKSEGQWQEDPKSAGTFLY